MRSLPLNFYGYLLAGVFAFLILPPAFGDGAGLLRRNNFNKPVDDRAAEREEQVGNQPTGRASTAEGGKTIRRATVVKETPPSPQAKPKSTDGSADGGFQKPRPGESAAVEADARFIAPISSPQSGAATPKGGTEVKADSPGSMSQMDSLLDKATSRPTETRTVAKGKGKTTPGFVSWRQRYELGPGDVLTFAFAGRSDLLRQDVKISPEGTVSYLQAVQVKAAGKTVDELRAVMNEKLAAYHKSPKVIITPVEVGSKRYTIMGQVRQSGTFPLDRPMNLLEAIANSSGIQVGVATSETVELADFDRSFLVRGNRKMPVDFAKLYLDGDLSQNIELEPDDYIYIASNLRNEFYLLGAVNRQGANQLTSRLTVAGAIASASGFSDKAWRQRVLLVRGSIHKPEAIVVNVNDILRGRVKDIAIQPRDIIYVHTRPWAFAEDILDNAIKDFLSAASVSAVEKYYLRDRR